MAGILTVNPDAGTSMDADKLIEVYTTTDAADAEIIRIALQNEGIACEITDEHQAAFTGLGFAEIHLLVRAIDADRARKYIEQHQGHEE